MADWDNPKVDHDLSPWVETEALILQAGIFPEYDITTIVPWVTVAREIMTAIPIPFDISSKKGTMVAYYNASSGVDRDWNAIFNIRNFTIGHGNEVLNYPLSLQIHPNNGKLNLTLSDGIQTAVFNSTARYDDGTDKILIASYDISAGGVPVVKVWIGTPTTAPVAVAGSMVVATSIAAFDPSADFRVTVHKLAHTSIKVDPLQHIESVTTDTVEEATAIWRAILNSLPPNHIVTTNIFNV